MPDILELYKSGAVVMGETQEELLLHLLPLHPLRQGFCIQDGVGRTKICLGGQLFPLSPVQEMLWRDANGSVTLQHMLQQNNLLTVTPEDLLHELILLTAADLYYFR